MNLRYLAALAALLLVNFASAQTRIEPAKPKAEQPAKNQPARNRLGGPRFILQIDPMGGIISHRADDFMVKRNSAIIGEWGGYESWTPILKFGASFEEEETTVDVLGGIGYLYNVALDGAFYTLETAIRRKLGHGGATLGPHVGLILLGDAQWDSDAPVDVDGNLGWFAGLSFAAGNDKVSFVMSLDYVNVEYDMSVGPGWTMTQSYMDLSGIWYNFGMIIKF